MRRTVDEPPTVSDAPLLPGAIEQYLAGRVPQCGPDETAGDVREALSGQHFDAVDELAVCTPHFTGGPRLLGLVPLPRVLAADPDLPMEVPVLLAEHDQDFARLGGYLASTASARRAMEEPVPRRLWHRTPWLALGLAGAAISAWLVGLFEGRIEADVRLAFFIPGVVYLADAVGTQTEALVVRGLSVGTSIRTALRLEVLTGPALGLLLAGVSFPAIWVALGDVEVALAVSLALLAACSVATVVAAGLPVLMARAGRDPAFGSGPLATVVQDLLSLVIYLVVAVWIVTGA
jgi:magnesium transporter